MVLLWHPDGWYPFNDTTAGKGISVARSITDGTSKRKVSFENWEGWEEHHGSQCWGHQRCAEQQIRSVWMMRRWWWHLTIWCHQMPRAAEVRVCRCHTWLLVLKDNERYFYFITLNCEWWCWLTRVWFQVQNSQRNLHHRYIHLNGQFNLHSTLKGPLNSFCFIEPVLGKAIKGISSSHQVQQRCMSII